jgi:hypothetical protein
MEVVMSHDFRTARRSNALLRALSTDFLLREQFVTDPTGMLSEYVGRTAVSAEARDAANQLVFAVLSNPRVLESLRQRAATAGNPGRAALADVLAKAVGDDGDPVVAASLIRAGATKQAPVGLALDLLGAMVVAGQGAAALAGAAPRPVTGTESTPGSGIAHPVTGTESTPGSGIAHPVTGTESTLSVAASKPVTGTESTMGAMSDPVTGTESTVGVAAPRPMTGTESTMGAAASQPVTGTESTMGGLVGGWGEQQVLVQSLVEYATQLRSAGLLDKTGFE